MISQLFDAATRVSNLVALGAFGIAGIAAIFFFLVKFRGGKVPPVAWGAIVGIVLLGIIPIILNHSSLAIYRVRVTVVGPQGTPVDDAKVWSSMGGEPKKVAGGWQFDIPSGSRPADGKLTVWAALEAAYLKGSTDVQLQGDLNPAASIQLTSDQTASVRGLVTDRSGRSIAGARVSVAGYENEAILTQTGGNFVLPAHAARDQNVLLHAEAKGYIAATQWHPAGDHPAMIILDRK
jgi:hypothetical protein